MLDELADGETKFPLNPGAFDGSTEIILLLLVSIDGPDTPVPLAAEEAEPVVDELNADPRAATVAKLSF